MHCLLIVGAYGTLGRLVSSILGLMFVLVLFVLRDGEIDLYQVFSLCLNRMILEVLPTLVSGHDTPAACSKASRSLGTVSA